VGKRKKSPRVSSGIARCRPLGHGILENIILNGSRRSWRRKAAQPGQIDVRVDVPNGYGALVAVRNSANGLRPRLCS